MSISNISILITSILLVVLFIAGSVKYDHFCSFSTIFNIFNDNAYLMIAGIGITFVLITGEIDISIASNIAFTSVFSAYLLQKGWSAIIVIPLLLMIGTLFGAFMGYLIHTFKMQSFIITLAGQFFLRGMCSVVTTQAIAIDNKFYTKAALSKITIAGGKIYYYVFVALIVLAVAVYTLKFTAFGRNVYAVGGNRTSAELMGLPIARTRISVYAICGFCATLAGIIYSFYTLAGEPLQNIGMELDAISSAVIGGTLLTGGIGSVIGTIIGTMIQGIIRTIVTYQNLNTWWTKVTIALLLCAFILLQRIIVIRSDRAKKN